MATRIIRTEPRIVRDDLREVYSKDGKVTTSWDMRFRFDLRMKLG
jgi:hypothetical protein